MANKTVVLSNYFLSGTANLTLLLLNPTNGNIGNGSGDTLTAGSNGLFSAVVTEAITGWWNVVVLDGATVLAEGGSVYFPSDTVGTYIVDDASLIPDTIDAINITVAPLQAIAPNRVAGTEVITYINDVSAIGPVVVTDSNGDAVDLSALTLKVCIEKVDGTILANVTPTVSGAGNNQVTFTPNADSVAKTGVFRWSLRETTSKTVYAFGDFVVDPVARLS